MWWIIEDVLCFFFFFLRDSAEQTNTMDESLSLTPTGPLSPLRTSTPSRVNQHRESSITPFRTDLYDSPVLERISQFNNMSGQSRQLERKANDALKRAVLGREEAEGEMRRLKDEIAQLQYAVEQGGERERKVGERLETVMVRNSSRSNTLWTCH